MFPSLYLYAHFAPEYLFHTLQLLVFIKNKTDLLINKVPEAGLKPKIFPTGAGLLDKNEMV